MSKLKTATKWVSGAIATLYTASVLQNTQAHLEEEKPYDFPDKTVLNPIDSPDHTQRQITPLWAPTSYLQGIDCEQPDYEIKDIDGTSIHFQKHEVSDPIVAQAAEDVSLGYSIYVNDDNHAIINFKAIGKPFESNEHEQADGIVQDVFERDEQERATEMLINYVLESPEIETVETVGFAQGSAKVYYLAEKHGVLGTIISDTGTNFDSDRLGEYVVALDAPGDIHSFPVIGNTGEHKPAYAINLGQEHDFEASQLYTPVVTSWVEKIQTLAFQYPEAHAPENYQDQGLKLLNPDGVCNNPSMDND